MLRKHSNITTTFLNDVSKLSAALPIVGASVTPATLEQGAIVLTNVGMQRITSLASLNDGEQAYIVVGKGPNKPLLKTAVITKGKTSITSKKHIARRQQISTIGFNGTDGTLPAANSTYFHFKVRKNDNDAANRSQPESIFGQYKTSNAGTERELAFGLAQNGIVNFKRQPANGYLKIEVIADGAFAALTNNATVEKGSKTVASTAHGLVAGDLVRIGGTASTVAVYEVASATTDAFVLGYAYQGDSGTVLAANIGKLTGSTLFGLKLTGVQANFDVTSFRDYYVNRFSPTFSDDSVPVRLTQGAFNGNGVWQQVAMDEYMTYGFEGQNEMLSVPPKARDQEVKIPGVGGVTELTAKYSAINIAWTEDTGDLVHVGKGQGSFLIYLNLSDAAGSGSLSATANTGSTLATALGLTPADLNE